MREEACERITGLYSVVLFGKLERQFMPKRKTMN